MIAIIGVHDGEAHANLSVPTGPAMFGINCFFRRKVAQLWKQIQSLLVHVLKVSCRLTLFS